MMYIINDNPLFDRDELATVDGTLCDAKAAADDAAAYSQYDIIIEDENGREVARRVWWGAEYNPEEAEEAEDEIISFGQYGYFGAWQ